MQFQILPEDYIAAVRLNLRLRTAGSIARGVIVAVAAIAFVVSLWQLLQGRFESWDVLGLVAIPYLLFWRCVLLPRRIRKLYGQQRSLHEPYEMSFDATGISTSRPSASGTLSWVNVHKWRESKELFLVYQSDALFNIFPKRHFVPATEIDRFRELLIAHTGRADLSFKPKPARDPA